MGNKLDSTVDKLLLITRSRTLVSNSNRACDSSATLNRAVKKSYTHLNPRFTLESGDGAITSGNANLERGSGFGKTEITPNDLAISVTLIYKNNFVGNRVSDFLTRNQDARDSWNVILTFTDDRDPETFPSSVSYGQWNWQMRSNSDLRSGTAQKY